MSIDTANKLRSQALKVFTNATRASFAMAAMLYETYYGTIQSGDGSKLGRESIPLWEAWGFKSWNDYAERELEIHQSTAASYRRVHEVFQIKIGGNWDSKYSVSFTKLRALCRVVTPENVNVWLKRASKMSCCEVDEAVQAVLHGKKRAGANRHFAVFLTNRELIQINSIIEVGHQKFPEVERRGEILTKILEQWNQLSAKPGIRRSMTKHTHVSHTIQ